MAGQKNPRNYIQGAQAEIRGERIVVPTKLIAPDPRNYNVMGPAQFTKLVETIRVKGFLDDLHVREKKGSRNDVVTLYETINGEHRLHAADELSMPMLPVVNLGKVSDEEAEEIAILLNELKGNPDQVRLADRLQRISKVVPFDALVRRMPYTGTELSMYIRSVDFSFANLSGDDTRPAPTTVDATQDEKRISFKLPTKRADKVLALLEQMGSDPSAAFEQCVLDQAKKKGVTAVRPTRTTATKVRKKRSA